MAKKIMAKGEEARSYLLQGFKEIYDAVSITAGPKGRWVNIGTPFRSRCKLTKDGVTVARSIELDGFVNEGCKIVQQAANVQLDKAGDGTTANVILTYAIAREGLRDVSAGANPQDLKKGIELAVSKCTEYIKEKAKPIKSEEEVYQVTTISANSDTELGKLVSQAIKDAGEYGLVDVDDSKSSESYIESIAGYRIDKGFSSAYYATNEKGYAEYDNPAVILVDGKVTNLQAVAQLVSTLYSEGRAVVFLAEHFDDLIKQVFLENRFNAGLKIIPIEISQYDKKYLEDISLLTNATLITEEMGMDITNWNTNNIGTCSKVRATKNQITFIGFPKSNEEKVQEQINKLINQIDEEKENEDNAYEIQKMKKRLGYLTNGVHIIKVGGINEVEVSEKKDRIDDALHAGYAAREEGIVPGGGIIYLRILSDGVLDNIKGNNADQDRGIDIVRRALVYPTTIIVKNAGERAEWVVGTIVEGDYKSKFNYGYNAQNGAFGDMYEMGIIDPAKVSRIALESAAKSACDLLTTELIIIDKPEDKKADK